MIVYMTQGQKTVLSRITVEGLPLHYLSVGRGYFARRRALHCLRQMYDSGVRRCICADVYLLSLAKQADITSYPVLPLRLALLGSLLDILCPGGLQNAAAVLRCGPGGEETARAARLVLDGLEGFRDDYEEHILHHRCLAGLQLPVPCVALCPAGVDVPGYMALIGEGRCADAVRLIRKDNPFPVACAYICEHPCEARCRRNMIDDAINIRGLKRYAVDTAGDVPQPPCAPPTGKKVAIIGGGPSGLSCAYYLALMGHKVTVFEEREKLGGMLRYGIPNYRFPRHLLDAEIASILSLGIEAHTGVTVGTQLWIEDLLKEYDCLYIAIGAHQDKKVGIPGEDSKNVMSAVEMLRSIGNDVMPDFTGKRVVVIGGGNVAMDVTRSSIRLGAEKVTCVYRRRIEDMTALPDEVTGAMAEGAEIAALMAPSHIEADENGNAAALWVQPQIIGEADRWRRSQRIF